MAVSRAYGLRLLASLVGILAIAVGASRPWIQTLGGVPHASMTALSEAATVEAEDEDVYDIRTSLSNDLEMYGGIIKSYREHIQLVEGLGDYASGEMLREQLEDIEEHAHVIDHYLEDDTPVLESATH